MKKSIIKTLSAFLVLVLVLSVLPMAAFASASETFFLTNCSGFRCTGSGLITSTQVNATFSATALPNAAVQPDECYSSVVHVEVYNSTGTKTGEVTSYGNIYTSATYVPTGVVHEIHCEFEFAGWNLGEYTLQNSQE